MKRSKYTDEPILAIVKEGEAGRKVADLCRTHGITEQTYYRWKAKTGLPPTQRTRKTSDYLAASVRSPFRRAARAVCSGGGPPFPVILGACCGRNRTGQGIKEPATTMAPPRTFVAQRRQSFEDRSGS